MRRKAGEDEIAGAWQGQHGDESRYLQRLPAECVGYPIQREGRGKHVAGWRAVRTGERHREDECGSGRQSSVVEFSGHEEVGREEIGPRVKVPTLSRKKRETRVGQ